MKRRRKGTKKPSKTEGEGDEMGSAGETGCAAPGRGERGCMNRRQKPMERKKKKIEKQ